MKKQNKSQIPWLDSLRNLAGIITAAINKREYQRFNIGDRVKYFDANRGWWDSGEVIYTRTAGVYVVRNPDGEQQIVDWSSLRPNSN